MIKFSELSVTEATFYFHANDEPNPVWIAIDRLQSYIETRKYEISKFYLDKNLADFIAKNNGIEEHRIASMPEERLHIPCIGIVWEDGTQIIADGNHRLVARYRKGFDYFEAYMVLPWLWRTFLIDPLTVPGTPEQWRKAHAENIQHPPGMPYKLK